MVRHVTSGVTKSKAKEELQAFCPEAWCDKVKIKHNVVYIDALQIIQDCINSDGVYQDWKRKCPVAADTDFADVESTTEIPKVRKFADVVRVFNDVVMKYIKLNAKVVVLIFDKSKFVPKEKSIIHGGRSKSHKVELKDAPPLKLYMDSDINPEHWQAYMDDRFGCRVKIISEISFHMLNHKGIKSSKVFENGQFDDSTDSVTHFHPRLWNDTLLFVDGHCMTKQKLELLGIKRNMPEEELYKTPIFLSKTSIGYNLDLYDSLRNKIGEAELVPPFYLSTLPWDLMSSKIGGEDIVAALVITTDTDMVWISTVYLDKLKRKNNGKDLPIINVLRTRIYSKPEFFQANVFYDKVETCPQLSGLSNKVMSLMVAIWSAGCDYTLHHNWVTHSRFIEAMLNYADSIGDVAIVESEDGKPVENGVTIIPQAYLLLLVRAYRCAHNKRIPDSDRVDHNNINSYLDGSAIGSKTLEPTKFFPCHHDITYSILQVWWYAIMIASVGEKEVNIRDSRLYEYDKIDPEKEYEIGNIKWKLCSCSAGNIDQIVSKKRSKSKTSPLSSQPPPPKDEQLLKEPKEPQLTTLRKKPKKQA